MTEFQSVWARFHIAVEQIGPPATAAAWRRGRSEHPVAGAVLSTHGETVGGSHQDSGQRQQPVAELSGKRLRVHILSATASHGTLWDAVFTGRVTAMVFSGFLNRPARQSVGRST